MCVCPCAHGRPHTTQLYQHVPETRWPIVYSPRYNITFMGLEKLHPFDAGKWGKVISFLKGMEGPVRPYICSFQPTSPTPAPSPLPVSSLTQAALFHLQAQPSDCLPLVLAKSLFNRL